MVQQHDGALFDAGGAGDRGLQRVGAVDPVGARRPGAVQQFVAQLLGLRGAGVGTDHGAQAGLADVGVRKAHEHRRGQRLALGLQLDAARLQRPVGSTWVPWRSTCGSMGRLPQAITGRISPLSARATMRAARGGGMDVDVRVGVIAGYHGRVPDHVVVQIGMHVQRHRHRDVRRDFADAAQQVAFRVFQVAGHHGSVQVQQHRVVAAARQLVQHGLAQRPIGLGRGGAAGPGGRGHRNGDVRAGLARHVQVAGQAAVGAAVQRHRRVARDGLGAAAEEAFQRGGDGRERVRLMLDHCQ